MARQLNLVLEKGKHGGRRKGCGRKRKKSKGVSHRTREKVTNRTPLHINFKFKSWIKNKRSLALLKKSIQNARAHGLRIIHFSLQGNHVHLIIEASDNHFLTTGMRSLTITFAKGLNKGRIQVERYHLHVLRSLRETRNAVLYVLFNKQKHEKGIYSVIDEYSSLLSLGNCLDLVREFARKKRMVIRVAKGERWGQDSPQSYLLVRSLV